MESLSILLAVGHDVSKKRTWDPDRGRTFKAVLALRAKMRSEYHGEIGREK